MTNAEMQSPGTLWPKYCSIDSTGVILADASIPLEHFRHFYAHCKASTRLEGPVASRRRKQELRAKYLGIQFHQEAKTNFERCSLRCRLLHGKREAAGEGRHSQVVGTTILAAASLLTDQIFHRGRCLGLVQTLTHTDHTVIFSIIQHSVKSGNSQLR